MSFLETLAPIGQLLSASRTILLILLMYPYSYINSNEILIILFYHTHLSGLGEHSDGYRQCYSKAESADRCLDGKVKPRPATEKLLPTKLIGTDFNITIVLTLYMLLVGSLIKIGSNNT